MGFVKFFVMPLHDAASALLPRLDELRQLVVKNYESWEAEWEGITRQENDAREGDESKDKASEVESAEVESAEVESADVSVTVVDDVNDEALKLDPSS